MDYKKNPKRQMNKERAAKFVSGFMGGGGSIKDKIMSGLGMKPSTAQAEKPKKKKKY